MEELVAPMINACKNRPDFGTGSERTPAFQASLAETLAQRVIAFQEFADFFAREVARLYVAGQLSFEEGDNAIGWLHGFALMGPQDELLDGLAWQVYLAFDAGEYHPTGSAAGEDLPQKYTLPRLRQLLSSAEA